MIFLGDNIQTAVTVAKNAGMVSPMNRVILVEANEIPGSFSAYITWKPLEENKTGDYRTLVSIWEAGVVQQLNKLSWNALNNTVRLCWCNRDQSFTIFCMSECYVLGKCLKRMDVYIVLPQIFLPSVLSCEQVFANCLASFKNSFAETQGRFVSSPHA